MTLKIQILAVWTFKSKSWLHYYIFIGFFFWQNICVLLLYKIILVVDSSFFPESLLHHFKRHWFYSKIKLSPLPATPVWNKIKKSFLGCTFKVKLVYEITDRTSLFLISLLPWLCAILHPFWRPFPPEISIILWACVYSHYFLVKK